MPDHAPTQHRLTPNTIMPTIHHMNHQINGLVDERDVANKFAEFFEQACSVNSELRNSELKEEYESLRHNYFGSPFDHE